MTLLVALPTAAEAAFPGKNGKIAFVRGDANGVNYIWVMESNGSNPVLFTQGRDPAWSPDGMKMAFTRRDDIWVINADGTGEQLLVSAAFTYDPAWTPDGQKITFTRHTSCGADGCDNDLRTMNADGTGVVPHPTRGSGSEAAWSPSGAKLAYVDYDWVLCFCGDIRTTNPDGSGAAPFCCTPSNPPPHGPSWAPDGSAIVFGHPTHRVAKQNADGSGFMFLSPAGDPSERFPAWSPDGNKIAFVRFGDSAGSIYVMDADGSSPVQLTTGTWPDWQPIPINSYPRPKAATPIEATLVPAYAQCTSPNRTHGPPLAYGSCSPPAQASDELTLGTPDANAKPVRGEGFVRYHALAGNPANQIEEGDVRITVELHDVYAQGTLAGYTGELRARTTIRITDKLNTPHPGGPGAATVSDTTLAATVPCTATPSQGADCAIVTSADALAPGSVIEGRRAVWELGQVQVDDGGADGDADTPGDNTLFMTQGLFVP